MPHKPCRSDEKGDNEQGVNKWIGNSCVRWQLVRGPPPGTVLGVLGDRQFMVRAIHDAGTHIGGQHGRADKDGRTLHNKATENAAQRAGQNLRNRGGPWGASPAQIIRCGYWVAS